MGTFAQNGGSVNRTLHYDYSTKNFHRFAANAAPGSGPKEIYVSRADMPQPVEQVELSVVVRPGVGNAVEKSKPARA